MGRRAVLVATTILILGVTSSVSAGAPWTDHGWARLAVKAYQRSDVCRNLPGVQTTVPPGHTKDASGACLPTPTPTPTTPPLDAIPDPQPGFTRVFTDEFDGTAVDTSKAFPTAGPSRRRRGATSRTTSRSEAAC